MEQNRKTIRIALIVLSILIVAAGAISIAVSGVVSAKYKRQEVAETVPVTVLVSADLATGLDVLEHKAARNDMGDYDLTSSEVTSNSYVLMPGVNVNKDPFVRVTGKTEIQAYLYIEVVDQTNSTYNYTIDSSNWTALKDSDNHDAPGKYGGKVYYYNTVLSKSMTPQQSGNMDIYILTGNTVTVDPDLDLSSNYTNAGLTFYAYMAQAADSKSEWEIYRTQILS